MKTTLDIDDQLLLAAKQRALDTGSTLRQVVESALSQLLKPRPAGAVPIRTVVFEPAQHGVSDAMPTPSELNESAFDMNSRRYWKKRFGFVPPGVK